MSRKYILLPQVYPMVAIPEECLKGAPLVLSEIKYLSAQYTDKLKYKHSAVKADDFRLIDESEISTHKEDNEPQDQTQDSSGDQTT